MHSISPALILAARHLSRAFLIIAAAVVLAGCASDAPAPMPGSMPSAGQANQAGIGDSQAQTQGREAVARGLRGIPAEDRAQFTDPDNPLSTRIIYFDFDSSSISPEYADVIRAHARYLANHPKVTLRVEGHTDKRGTREYNIALGERRAESVKQALSLAGADPSQISTLSFGEERPAVMGDSEQAYAKNRRAVLIYTE